MRQANSSTIGVTYWFWPLTWLVVSAHADSDYWLSVFKHVLKWNKSNWFWLIFFLCLTKIACSEWFDTVTLSTTVYNSCILCLPQVSLLNTNLTKHSFDDEYWLCVCMHLTLCSRCWWVSVSSCVCMCLFARKSREKPQWNFNQQNKTSVEKRKDE